MQELSVGIGIGFLLGLSLVIYFSHSNVCVFETLSFPDYKAGTQQCTDAIALYKEDRDNFRKKTQEYEKEQATEAQKTRDICNSYLDKKVSDLPVRCIKYFGLHDLPRTDN